MEFRVGEKVVYPNHGVGIIEQVCQRQVAGLPEEFYLLRIESCGSVVMVPTANVETVGLRKVIKSSDVGQLFDILKKKCTEPEADWKDRYKENSEKMRSGSVFLVGEVLRNLFYLSNHKALSFREKRMLDRARQLVICEVATVKNLSKPDVEKLVDQALVAAYRKSRKSSSNHN